MLKRIGLVNNYLVFQHMPEQPLESGLVEINSDEGVLEMLKYLGLDSTFSLTIAVKALDLLIKVRGAGRGEMQEEVSRRL